MAYMVPSRRMARVAWFVILAVGVAAWVPCVGWLGLFGVPVALVFSIISIVHASREGTSIGPCLWALIVSCVLGFYVWAVQFTVMIAVVSLGMRR